MNCRRIQRWGNTKNDAIREMINHIEREKFKNNSFPKITKMKKFELMIKSVKTKEAAYKESREKLEVELKKHNCSYNSYSKDKPISLSHSCFVPEKTLDELQMAMNLTKLGNNRKAKEIYDKLIKEYKLEKLI